MFIRTQRLFLRPAWREDAPELRRLLNESGLQRDLAGSPWLETMADTEQFLGAGADPQEIRLLIFRRTENEPQLIGATGLGRAFKRNEFGLWLDRGERRRGYAQEAGRAVLALAFDGLRLNNVWSPAFQQGAAGRLIARLGFRRPYRESAAAVLESEDWDQDMPHLVAA